MNIGCTHSNLNFAHLFFYFFVVVIYWLLQNVRETNQHQESHQRSETIHNEFAFYEQLGRQKWPIGWAKYVYVSDICADGIFVLTKNYEK